MDSSPAPQNQPDSATSELVKLFTQAVDDGRGLNAITEVVSQQIQGQIEQTLVEFGESIRQSNLTALELMAEELERAKSDSATVKGVLERLKAVAAPDIPSSTDELVSYRQAINNLEMYGSIIPSNSEIANAHLIARKKQAWSLLWQSVIKLVIKQVQVKLEGGKP